MGGGGGGSLGGWSSGSNADPPGSTTVFILGSGHDTGPGTVAVGMVSAAAAVLALGVLGVTAARRRRRDDVVAAPTAALAYAMAPVGPQPIPPPPGPEAPPPWQTLTGRAPAKFVAGAGSNVERRTISYRFVKVTDGPDDLRFREIGRLDRGDEVEVIGEQDGMLNVRTATGLVGWVPRVVIVG
jgi:MYXO-CTERM domain-containing protein